MKSLSYNVKRLLAVVLAMAMMLTTADWSVMKAYAAEDAVTSIETNEPEVDQVIYSDIFHTEDAVQTTMRDLQRGEGAYTVPMTGTNEVRWIDRIADLPESVMAFYETLEEGCDYDGTDDCLMNDETEIWLEAATVQYTLEAGEDYNAKAEEMYYQYVPYVYAAYACFDRDHPEVFWLDGSMHTGYSASSKSGVWTLTVYFIVRSDSNNINIRIPYFYDTARIESPYVEMGMLVEVLTSNLDGQSDYEKIRWINQYLTEINEYNSNVAAGEDAYDQAWECISAIYGNIGVEGPVCEGYARAFKVFCDKLEIPCVLVDGYAGGPHMWNNVEVDDAWYAIDVTWNDPLGGTEGAVSGYENEDWLLVGANTVINGEPFAESHVVENHPNDFTQLTNGPVLSLEAYDPNSVEPELPEVVSVEYEYDGGQWIRLTVFDDGTYTESEVEGKPDFTEADWVYIRNTDAQLVLDEHIPCMVTITGGTVLFTNNVDGLDLLGETREPGAEIDVTVEGSVHEIWVDEDFMGSVQVNGTVDAFSILTWFDQGDGRLEYEATDYEGCEAGKFWIVDGEWNEDLFPVTETMVIVNHYTQYLGEEYADPTDENNYEVFTQTFDLIDIGTEVTFPVLDLPGFTAPEPYPLVVSEENNQVHYYYTRNSYALSVDEQPYVQVIGAGTYQFEELVELQFVIAPGYELDHIEINAELLEFDAEGCMFMMPAEDVEIHVEVVPVVYSITYTDVDQAELNPATYTIETETFTLVNPTRDGYKFIGWTGSNGDAPEMTVTIEKGTIGDLNFTACWEKAQVIVQDDELIVEEGAVVEVVSEEIPEEALEEEAPELMEYVTGEEEFCQVYEITLIVDEEEVHEEFGALTLIFNVGTEYAGKKAVVYHRHENGEVTSEEVTVAEDGTVTIRVTDLSCFMISIQEDESINVLDIFTDLNEGDWFLPYVEYVVEQGLMNGTGNGTTFAPNLTINRASMVTILYRISGDNVTASPEEKAAWIANSREHLTDVIPNFWYEEAIAWAYTKGVTSGTGDGTTFSPEGVITREQFVLFLYKFSNYLGYDTSERADLTTFADYETVDSWAMDGMAWGVGAGLMTCKTGNRLAPLDEASRAEAATLISRFHQKHN